MRTALALAFVLVGCAQQDNYPPDYPPQQSGPSPVYPPTTYGCTSDSQCGTGQVCARTFECLGTAYVHSIHITWTIQTMAATQTACSTASANDLEIDFSGNGEDPWGYAPVPCMEGKFSIDKMPIAYSYVNLGRDGDVSSGGGAKIDVTTGDAAIDLPY